MEDIRKTLYVKNTKSDWLEIVLSHVTFNNWWPLFTTFKTYMFLNWISQSPPPWSSSHFPHWTPGTHKIIFTVELAHRETATIMLEISFQRPREVSKTHSLKKTRKLSSQNDHHLMGVRVPEGPIPCLSFHGNLQQFCHRNTGAWAGEARYYTRMEVWKIDLSCLSAFIGFQALL